MKRLVRNSMIQYIIIILHTKYNYSSWHGFTEIFTKFHYLKNGKKKIGQIQIRIHMRRLVRNPTIQYIIINLHTKYDYSSLHSFTEIFDEKLHYSKYGKKENWTNAWKNKHDKAWSQYIIINLHTKYGYPSLHGFTEIFIKFHYLKNGKKENWTNTGKNKHEKAGS